MLRMPDFYTRLHAASVIETLGGGLILFGLLLQAGFTLVAVKLIIVGLLVFFASPTATHALAKAAMERGIKPLLACRGVRVIETLIINVLLVLMAVTVVVLARNRNLFAVIVLSGLYSFLMATVLVALDAVDVAMTEASVGAGMSTVLLLGALHLCSSEEARGVHRPWLPLAVSVALRPAAGLRHARACRPFPTRPAPIHTHVVPRYLQQGPQETGVPNVVTAVLASYRGYDTLGRDDGRVHRRCGRRCCCCAVARGGEGAAQ